MTDLLYTFAQEIEAKMLALSEERFKDGLLPLGQARVTLLGQFSLLVNPEINSKLQLANTADVDAILKCDWAVRTAIKGVIASLGFVYDELSEEVWIPPNSKFVLLYESDSVAIEALEPIYALLSKAVKAPHKNRFLIQQAIGIYGETLLTLIKEHGGDLSILLK